MAEDSAQDKTEEPTDKKRSDAREKGNVAKSTEINSVLVLFAVLLLFQITGKWMWELMVDGCMRSFAMISHPQMSTSDFLKYFIDMSTITMLAILPVILGIMVVGVLANVLQVGFLMSSQALMPKFERISPAAGFKRLFGMRSLVELAKNILKIVIIASVVVVTIQGEMDNLLRTSDVDMVSASLYLLRLCFLIIFRIALVLIFLAILDYAYQKFDFEKKLKMTQQEIKEERKSMDGDPQIKARIRSLQREMSRRRMMKEVPKATVVVTNPTHIAIAIRYVPDEMESPVVIAKGKRLIAQKIRDTAKEHDIPIVEDKPLARAMYDKIEPGMPIPAEFFTAVAEILAYVYKLRKRWAA